MHIVCVCVCVCVYGSCASTNACTVISHELQSASTNVYSQSCIKRQNWDGLGSCARTERT
jgi:hypothetical protein